ncbi:MAG: nucleotidyltransferase domain-containing protein [Oscillospiraceae bacterium]|nr:nucleotidyltransferase domain-containing protein [Oscillospiraceae bacterium]
MYTHHKESIEILKKYYKEQGAIAVILGGSIAKGTERADSDIDAMVVLQPEDHAGKAEAKATAETINGLCTYSGGYFDIKYMTKEYLTDLARRGSEPARNGFLGAKVLFSDDSEIEQIITGIPVFQKAEKEEKLLSFYSDFWLNYYYFLKSCPIDGYMRMRTVAEIIYSLYRMILQENEILFDCNRRLEQQVESISSETAELVERARILETSQMAEDADRFVEKFYEITKYVPPRDLSEVLTTYAKDFQEWWREPRPNINEW